MACLNKLNIGQSVRLFDTLVIFYLKQYQQYCADQIILYGSVYSDY
jgi:hypothetical protein